MSEFLDRYDVAKLYVIYICIQTSQILLQCDYPPTEEILIPQLYPSSSNDPATIKWSDC